MPKFALLYQAGICNVIDISDPTEPRRVLQHAFSPCEWYAHALCDLGHTVEIYSLNRAGDVLLWPITEWTQGLADCPFRDKARPPRGARYAQ